MTYIVHGSADGEVTGRPAQQSGRMAAAAAAPRIARAASNIFFHLFRNSRLVEFRSRVSLITHPSPPARAPVPPRPVREYDCPNDECVVRFRFSRRQFNLFIVFPPHSRTHARLYISSRLALKLVPFRINTLITSSVYYVLYWACVRVLRCGIMHCYTIRGYLLLQRSCVVYSFTALYCLTCVCLGTDVRKPSFS
jgi:hypothetical protein